MKTVLITGGSGFLGINLVRHLHAKGVEEIRVLDIAPFDYPEAKEPWLKFTKGDVRDPAAVNRCVEGCDVVVNTAAALPLYSPEDIRTTEVDGARNVITACRRAGLFTMSLPTGSERTLAGLIHSGVNFIETQRPDIAAMLLPAGESEPHPIPLMRY